MTKAIPISKGNYALVDDSDYESLKDYKWHTMPGRKTNYATRSEYKNGKQSVIAMHRQIMNPPAGMEVDHIDHNGLNNTRSNLRIATHSQNMQNSPVGHNPTGYKGVHLRAAIKWESKIKAAHGTISLGFFDSAEEAARAYDAAALAIFGEFASLNFPEAQPSVTDTTNRTKHFNNLRSAGLTLEAIGDLFRISRQRVHQIIGSQAS